MYYSLQQDTERRFREFMGIVSSCLFSNIDLSIYLNEYGRRLSISYKVRFNGLRLEVAKAYSGMLSAMTLSSTVLFSTGSSLSMEAFPPCFLRSTT